jgi:hypothetical protein
MSILLKYIFFISKTSLCVCSLRLSPAVFCICKAYEERKEKMEALQKEEVSSNLPQPHAHPVAVVIPARRGIASSSSPPQHSSVAPCLHLFDGRR